mgnify:CR=1 FL=1
MSRSRAAQRLSDFESSSVKLIAACALGLVTATEFRRFPGPVRL